MQFNGKTAVVSGAASGMALLFAQCYAAEGGNVVMCDINLPVLEEKAAEINQKGPGRAVAALCDVRDYNQVKAACQLAVDTFGSLNFVLNCAGGAECRMLKDQMPEGKHPFFEVPIEIYDWGLDVNLRGQLYFCHAAMAHMAKQKSGLIINMGSVCGVEGSTIDVAYATSKSGAMYGLTKSIALVGAPYNIRCNAVAPGPVLTRAAMANMRTLMGRAAEPQEIVDLLIYLASPKGEFFNGECLLIDGGRALLLQKVRD